MDSRVSPRKHRGTRPRLTRAAEIAAIVAAVVAVVTVFLQFGPLGGDAPDGGIAITPSSSATTPSPPPSDSGTPTPTAANTRYLTDLQPDSGGASVQRVGAHSLRMTCASGNSGDFDRAVTYVLPPATDYRLFTTTLSVAGQRDTRIQAFLLIDDSAAAQPVVTAGSSAPLGWRGERAGRLTLRIRCDPYATAATFTDPGLSG